MDESASTDYIITACYPNELNIVTGEKGCLSVLRIYCQQYDCLCGIVVIVPGYRFRGPGSIPGAARFSE
jgi:hypothetical protein